MKTIGCLLIIVLCPFCLYFIFTDLNAWFVKYKSQNSAVENTDKPIWKKAEYRDTKNGIRVYFLYACKPINEDFLKSLSLEKDELQKVRLLLEKDKDRVANYFSKSSSYPSKSIPPGRISEVYYDFYDGWHLSHIEISEEQY